jgi:hypothetical protein
MFFEDNFNVNLNRCIDKFPNLLTGYEKSMGLDRGPIQKQPYQIQ